MKIYYLQNENGEIVEDGVTRFSENCKEIEKEDYIIAEGYNGSYFFADYMETEEYKAKAATFSTEQELKRLRRLRERECFAVINRGELWYERLTESGKQELEIWYQAWLDVTETKSVPNKPEWLD